MSAYTFTPGGGAPPVPVVPGDVSYFLNLGALVQSTLRVVPARVFSMLCENTTGPAKYFQLHNVAAPIVLGAVPTVTIRVPASSVVVVGADFFGAALPAAPLLGGLPFSVGLVWAWSTTGATFTAAPVATQFTSITFV